jgi:hypothetical protein
MGDFRTALRDHRVAIKAMTASAAVAAAMLAGTTGVSALNCGDYCSGRCDYACQGHSGCQTVNFNPGDQDYGEMCQCTWTCGDGTHGS